MCMFRRNSILSSRRLAEVVVVLAMFVLDTVSMAGLIQLTDPSTNPEWRAIMFGSNQNDYLKDLQTGQAGADLVGLGNQPGAMWAFDGTNLGFRVRLDDTQKTYVLIGVDADQNGSIGRLYLAG